MTSRAKEKKKPRQRTPLFDVQDEVNIAGNAYGNRMFTISPAVTGSSKFSAVNLVATDRTSDGAT